MQTMQPLLIRTLRRALFASAWVAAVCVGAACNSPTKPSDVRVVSVKITGPAGGAPGVTLHFTATATYSDGSSRDVSSSAHWTVIPPAAATVYAGAVVGQVPGDVTLTVLDSEPLSTTIRPEASDQVNVLILVPGTYRLNVRLLDTLGGGIGSGSVQILSGTLQGQMATHGNGQNLFYGVSGPIRIQGNAEGYLSETQDLIVTSNMTDDLTLPSSLDPSDISGLWTLTLVGPSSSCPGGFPSSALGRTYQLRLTQHLTGVDMDVSSPTVTIVSPGNDGGRVDHNNVTLDFEMNLNDFTGELTPNILDRVNATDTFSFAGRLAGTLDGNEIRGSLNGPMFYWTGSISQTPIWTCTAPDHAVTLRRAGAASVRRAQRR
jgi:hypothetical protein